MHLLKSVVIRRSPMEVWSYLAELPNIEKWDRGVGSANAISGSPGVGFEFETLGRPDTAAVPADRARMAYRIVDIGPDSCTVALTSSTGNARFFKNASWRFSVSQAPEGCLLTCCVHFSLKLRYFFLGPILYVKKDALAMDLEQLREAIEAA